MASPVAPLASAAASGSTLGVPTPPVTVSTGDGTIDFGTGYRARWCRASRGWRQVAADCGAGEWRAGSTGSASDQDTIMKVQRQGCSSRLACDSTHYPILTLPTIGSSPFFDPRAPMVPRPGSAPDGLIMHPLHRCPPPVHERVLPIRRWSRPRPGEPKAEAWSFSLRGCEVAC
jgi:hypothetical protein